MADWNGYATEKAVTPFYEYDGAARNGINSNPHDGFSIEKAVTPFYEYDGESFCTCEESTPPIHTVSITPSAGSLAVQFSDLVTLSGPALQLSNWFITSDNGREVVVGNIMVSGNTVTLTVTPQTNGASYTLHLPTVGISSTQFGVFTGLFSLNFTGVPTPVSTSMIRTYDTHHIDVIFSIAVDPTDASNPDNYAIDHGLTITEAVRITDFWYRIRNDPRQTDGVNYTVTVSNIGPL